MQTLYYEVDSDGVVIPIGRVGENEVTQVVFDVSSYIETYGSGTVELVHRRKRDSVGYVCENVTLADEAVTWVVTSDDTGYLGQGKLQVRWYVDDALKKSAVFNTMTGASVSSSGSAPTEVQDALELILAYVNDNTISITDLDERIANYFDENPLPVDGLETELEDIRVGADGTVYQSAGDAVRGQITDLMSDLTYSLYKTTDESANFTSGKYIALNVGVGNTVDMTPVTLSDRGYAVFPCKKGDSFVLTARGGSAPRAWGFTDTAYKLLSVATSTTHPSATILTADADGYFITNHDITKDYALTATQLFKAIDEDVATALANAMIADNNDSVLGYKQINLFDSTVAVSGKYVNPNTGNLNDNADYFASDFIDVSGLDNVMIYGSQYVCCYAADKSFLGATAEADTRTEAKKQTLEIGTKYIRVSAANGYLNALQVGDVVFAGRQITAKNYILSDLLIPKEQMIDTPVIVDASGNGDYTSFTLAVKENYGNSRDILVKPGTYDINAEYIAIWGQSAVENMADADGEVFDGWQYGVRMNGRKFTFEPGSKIVCDRTNYTVNSTHRFSALRVEMDVEIIGLNLECTHCFYCIHDDYGVQTRPYTVKYKNCIVIGHDLTNSNCIGGGCKKWSRHILENCYFDNDSSTRVAVRYHNTNQAGAVPEIYVSGCYFSTYFTPCYYGTQTTKMMVYVNNCEANSIHIVQESGSYTEENVELYKWCCIEQAPVT